MMSDMTSWFLLGLCAFGYFLPTVIAMLRTHRSIMAIAALNALGGWTVIGWFGSLIWSLA